jgi:5-deoxy-glucuronate isomerase
MTTETTMTTSTTTPAISSRTCVVRNTAAARGRTRSVTPGATASTHLNVGRIILGATDAAVSVPAGPLETGLVCLTGAAAVDVGEQAFQMEPYDALYVPRDTSFRVAPGPGGCDLAEFAAPVDGHYPVQHIAFADVQRDPGLHFRAGGPACERELNILIGKNTQTGRLLAGVTFSAPGNWTSWPPHEHAAMLEEAYLYIAMPAPAFGVQLVYTDEGDPELATIVRQDDLVIMPRGYHPNVAAPGGPINFLWIMAAHREGVDRQFGVVNVAPAFAAGGSGIDRGRADAR